eukprot:4100077-Amphidinium_carterae.1
MAMQSVTQSTCAHCIWGLNRPPKDKHRHDGQTIEVIFVVDLLMLQEEYEVAIYQARSGNYFIPSGIPWNCVCAIINSRGTPVEGWSQRTRPRGQPGR